MCRTLTQRIKFTRQLSGVWRLHGNTIFTTAGGYVCGAWGKRRAKARCARRATGKALCRTRLCQIANVFFSPDSSCLCVASPADFKMFDADTGELLWERAVANGCYPTHQGWRCLVSRRYTPSRIAFLDITTAGVQKSTMAIKCRCIILGKRKVDSRLRRCGIHTRWAISPSLPAISSVAGLRRFMKRGLMRHFPRLLNEGKPSYAIVETATGRELFRGINRGNWPAALSEDGSTVAESVRREATIRIRFIAFPDLGRACHQGLVVGSRRSIHRGPGLAIPVPSPHPVAAKRRTSGQRP